MNRILYASDCLEILQDRDALPDESVDLIYLDPPFNSNSEYNLPFKGEYKNASPAKAFDDTWHWTDENTEQLGELEADPRTRPLADVVKFAQRMEKGSTSLAAYLLNMAIRLRAMYRVLRKTGSIYLHCDPTASHYLKLILDAVFGPRNFRNEITWKRRHGFSSAVHDSVRFGVCTDIILFYAKSDKAAFCPQYNKDTPEYQAYIEKHFRQIDKHGRRYQATSLTNPAYRPNLIYEYKGYLPPKNGWMITKEKMEQWDSEGRIHFPKSKTGRLRRKSFVDELKGMPIQNLWDDIDQIGSHSAERLGYPTQKPVSLLERIIGASSKEGDVVLDPFCGCGTTLHAAESLGRNWIGIDISSFATGLVRDRIVRAFDQLKKTHISMRGEIPTDVHTARALAERNKFEFEKWVCGHIGAEGMFHNPGTPGPDGGVDGVMKFFPVRPDKKWKAEYAIVQVKGGNVTPDAVRALRETVDRFEVTAGVMVCFDQYMTTVENQRNKDTFSDALGTYPVIQGYSVENLLADAPLTLPLYGLRRQGALLTA